MRYVTWLAIAISSQVAFSAGLMAAPPTSITFDGSLGHPAGMLLPSSPGFYQITPAMGKTVGSNLFQSFGVFNLGTGDTADFLGNVGTQNIIARVTGGTSSTIDGKIESAANLYFINPAGIMFTANATLNVNGAFVASTANYVKLSDGTFFYADTLHAMNDATVSSAPIAAFGFLPGSTPQAVTFTGSQFTNAGGLHVIAGDITLNGASLLAPAGNVTLFSAAGAGEVPFSLSSPGSGYANAQVSPGKIVVQNQSKIAIDGAGGGKVVIRGGKLTVDNSTISSLNDGGVMGGSISVQATTLAVQNGAFVGTDSNPGATAGAGSVSVNVTGNATVTGDSQIVANTETASNGGMIDVVVGGNLTLNNAGNILAATNGPGNSGSVTVQAGSANIGTGASGLSTLSAGTGNAGSIVVNIAGGLRMTAAGTITANSFIGKAGNIQVTAGTLALIDTNAVANTAGPTISADTFGAGAGGTVNVDAGSINIRGPGHLFPLNFATFEAGVAGITAESVGLTGAAGAVTVNANELALSGGGVISAAAYGPANGGSVTVNVVNGQLINQGEISSTSFINAGTITIDATQSLSLIDNSTITTSANRNGGNINLKVGGLLYLLNSNIEGYAGIKIVHGQSPNVMGGNISMNSAMVVLNGSLISANDLSPGGTDGNITNFTPFFFTSDSLLHATGAIETASPDVQLGSQLLPLAKDLSDPDRELRETCARSINHEFSTLTVTGRGGTENAPDELQPDFGIGEAPAKIQ